MNVPHASNPLSIIISKKKTEENFLNKLSGKLKKNLELHRVSLSSSAEASILLSGPERGVYDA